MSPVSTSLARGGVRVTLLARLGVARISLQVDIGFGDAVFPAPEEIEYPSLLGFPCPRLRAYSQATVVAEKFHAMVELGLVNSRLKDYLDIWTILQAFEVPPETLGQAIQATFQRRKTAVPSSLPIGLSRTFATDPQKQVQWKAFLRKTGADPNLKLEKVVSDLAGMIGKVLGIQ